MNILVVPPVRPFRKDSLMSASSMDQTKDTLPWYAAFPEVISTPVSISRYEVLNLMHERAVPGRDYLLVDLRRNDHKVSKPPHNVMSTIC